MVRQSERREKTRGKILDAAVRVLVEHGYAGASTTRIIEEAGVSRGAMLHHFPHKAVLMEAVLRHVLQVREQAFHRALEQAAGSDPVSAVIQAFWDAVSVDEAAVPWLELTVAARTEPQLREVLTAAAEDLEQVVADNFQRLFDVRRRPELATLFPAVGISLLQGLVLREVIQKNTERTQLVLDALKTLMHEQLSAFEARTD